MKIRNFLFVLGSAVLLSTACGKEEAPLDPNGGGGSDIEDPYLVPLVNGTFENGTEGWEIVTDTNGKKATVEIVDYQGVSESKCLKVQQWKENGPCYAGLKQKLTGLKPDVMYRITARIRYADIPNGEGCGACVYNLSTKQYWNCSKFLYGTRLDDWTTVTCDFMSDDNGTAEIVCALGFWQGGRANGGKSTGTAYFDNIRVREVTDELYMRESKHIRLFLEPSKVSVSNDVIDRWLANLDKQYEAYAELVGGTPHEGRKLAVLSTQAREYWAVAGYPIIWVADYVESTLNDIRDHDDWCFGIMHEIGHVFNIGNSNWDWNDEMFANFRMQYGLEVNDGKVWQDDRDPSAKTPKRVYQGNEIRDYYSYDYKTTIGSQVNDNGIHWMLANLTNYSVDAKTKLGWEPFKKALTEMNRASGNVFGNTKYDKFRYLINRVSYHASELYDKEIDLWNTFSEAEINSVRKQLQ